MIQSQIQIESSSNGTCELLNTVKSNYFGFYSSFLHLISVRKRKSANMENFDNYSSFNHLSEDLMYVKRAPNVRFREGYGMAEMSPAVTFTRLQVEQTVGVSLCGMVFVNRDQLMNNAIKPSVQHVVAVANFIGANTENLLFSFYKRTPSELQYFG